MKLWFYPKPNPVNDPRHICFFRFRAAVTSYLGNSGKSRKHSPEKYTEVSTTQYNISVFSVSTLCLYYLKNVHSFQETLLQSFTEICRNGFPSKFNHRSLLHFLLFTVHDNPGSKSRVISPQSLLSHLSCPVSVLLQTFFFVYFLFSVTTSLTAAHPFAPTMLNCLLLEDGLNPLWIVSHLTQESLHIFFSLSFTYLPLPSLP